MTNKPIILEFDSSTAEDLLEFYQQQINSTKKELEVLSETVAKTESKLKGLLHRHDSITRQLNRKEETHNDRYTIMWSLSKKTEFVIAKKKKLLTTRQIIEGILEFEPDILKKHGNDFDRFQKNLSSTLLQKVQSGKTFARYKSVTGEYRYGLEEWFEKGMPKKEFLKDTPNGNSFIELLNGENVVLNGQLRAG